MASGRASEARLLPLPGVWEDRPRYVTGALKERSSQDASSFLNSEGRKAHNSLHMDIEYDITA